MMRGVTLTATPDIAGWPVRRSMSVSPATSEFTFVPAVAGHRAEHVLIGITGDANQLTAVDDDRAEAPTRAAHRSMLTQRFPRSSSVRSPDLRTTVPR
jgi:hypothetical protein